MSNDAPSEATQQSGHVPPGIGSARAQVEAARSRQQRLVETGRLIHRDGDGDDMPANRSLPGYTLLRELHRGGQGIVYLAVQNSTGRQVAIKVLKRDLPLSSDAAALARFEREIEILSSLKHPNIVTIHDCGRDHGHVYLVMDYVDGRPLDAWLNRERSSLAEILELFARVCDGVNAAHLRGVIHRDLKPGNILVDARGEPHVLDFGLAKVDGRDENLTRDEVMTQTGQFVGSLPWASPEQAEGRMDALDIRSDVYSLGVLLYQVLTGRFPYPVKGRLAEVVAHIVGTEPERPSAIEGSIDRELETIVLKCLAKEPVRRYQNAGELGRDIRNYLSGEAIEARRDSLAYVMGKRLARYRAAAMVAAAMLLIVTAAMIVSIAFWRQASRQGALAQSNATNARESAAIATREAAQARAVNDFMREIITSVEPENQGADVPLIQVIHTASIEASQRFDGHPQQEAEVRDLLGQVYDRLSMWAEATSEFKQAASLWDIVAGPDDPRTLAVRLRFVQELLNVGRASEAEAVLENLVGRMERVHGPAHAMTLAAKRDVAMAALQRGRVDDAERMLLDLRARSEIAADDQSQIRLLIGLINVCTNRLGSVEPDHLREVLAKAEPLALEWIERSMRLHGADATMTLQARVKWAEIAGTLGRCSAAAEACRDVLEQPPGRLGPCHALRSNAMYVLAEAMTALGEDQEPAELLLQRLACVRQQLPVDSPAMIGSMYDPLRFLERAGRAVEGEALSRELHAALVRVGGGHDEMDYASELFVAHFVAMQNRLAEAEPMFQALLAREKDLGSDSRTRSRLHLYFGWYQLRRGAFEQAEAELKMAAEVLGDIRIGTWDVHPDDIALGFIALYEAWNKPEQAREYERLRDEIRAARIAPAK